jgi:four helix bundle protein
MISSYKDLNVYQKSYKLLLEIYEKTKELPKEEMYGITSQIRRAAMSIPLNIAEGYGKHTSESEFKRYLSIAIGSVNEVEVLINLMKDLGYLTQEKHEQYIESYIEVRKMLYGLREKWI